jgi:hypothetical protein
VAKQPWHHHLMDAKQATEVLEALLASWEKENGLACLPVGEPVEYGPYWVQGYQGRAFVLEGDVSAALAGNGPVAIPKDGSEPLVLSPTEPVEIQMRRLLAAR